MLNTDKEMTDHKLPALTTSGVPAMDAKLPPTAAKFLRIHITPFELSTTKLSTPTTLRHPSFNSQTFIMLTVWAIVLAIDLHIFTAHLSAIHTRFFASTTLLLLLTASLAEILLFRSPNAPPPTHRALRYRIGFGCGMFVLALALRIRVDQGLFADLEEPRTAAWLLAVWMYQGVESIELAWLFRRKSFVVGDEEAVQLEVEETGCLEESRDTDHKPSTSVLWTELMAELCIVLPAVAMLSGHRDFVVGLSVGTYVLGFLAVGKVDLKSEIVAEVSHAEKGDLIQV